jgi:hypothetical protein
MAPNLNTDPLFVDPAFRNLKLTVSSPCRDAGSGAIPKDYPDMDNNNVRDEPMPYELYTPQSRLVAGLLDLGCHEN